MSINSINGVNGYNYGMNQADSIKPETRQKLKELDINDTSIRTESQAQKKIEEKGKQYGVQNQQTGNEQSKAFAGSNAAQQQQVQPFALGNDIVAMYNKFKLGLI